MSAVRNLPDGGVAFLPYDFSDQYAGVAFLQAHRRADRSAPRLGAARGVVHFPFRRRPHLSSLRGFIVDGPAVQANIDELRDALHQSMIDLLASQADNGP
jgi:hypothetical protein